MAYIKRSPIWPDPRVKPPYGSVRVDSSHPLATIAVWLLNDCRTSRELCAGLAITPSSGTTFGVGAGGTMLSVPANESCAVKGPVSLDALGAVGSNYTVVQLLLSGPAVSSDRYGMQKTAAYRYAWAIQLLSGANLLFGVWDGAAFPYVGTTSGPAGDGRPHHYIFVRDAKAAKLRLYDNGAPLAAVVDSTTGTCASAGGMRINADYIRTSQTSCQLVYAYVIPRAVTGGEAAWLYSEPFCMFQPIIRRRYFVPAAGGLRIPVAMHHRKILAET